MFVIVRISIGFVIAVSGLYEIGGNFSLGCTALLSGGFIVLAGVERLCRADDVPDVPGADGGEDTQPNEPFTAKDVKDARDARDPRDARDARM